MGKWGGQKLYSKWGNGGVKNFTLNGEMGGGGQKLYSKWGNGGGVKDFTLNGEMGGGGSKTLL